MKHVVSMLTLAILASVALADPTDKVDAQPTAPEVLVETEQIDLDEFSITVPRGWKNSKFLVNPTRKLHIVGDGKGIPIFDENRAPLQTGISVERFESDETLDEGVAALTKSAKNAPGLSLVSEPTVEDTKLADATTGKVMSFQVLKRSTRRGLYIKLLLKGKAANSWVVTAWIVAGKDSDLPKPDSDLAKRLRSFVESFAFRVPAQD